MSKEVKVKIIDKEKLRFEILEDAQKGDFFILNNDENTETTKLVSEFLQNKYKSILEREIKDKEQKWNLSVNEKIQDKIKATSSELEKQYLEKSESLKMTIQELKTKQQSLENEIKSKLEIQHLNNLSEKDKQMNLLIMDKNNLQNQIRLFQRELENQKIILREKEVEWQKNISLMIANKELEIEKQKEKEIQNLLNEIENLKRSKNVNSKVMGEDLENWIKNEYDTTMGLLEDCSLEKINISIDNTKADFLFTVFEKNYTTKEKKVFAKVTIEAKTQGETGDSKNEKFFAKLERDRANNKSDYSLLVTELEREDEFVIKKINEYPNMYMIRPYYLTTFLSLVRLLALKQKDLMKSEIAIKSKQDVIAEIEFLKQDIFNTTIKKIDEKLLKIVSANEAIQKQSNLISDSVQIILNTHMKTIKNKIENFSINVPKKIDKIDKIKE